MSYLRKLYLPVIISMVLCFNGFAQNQTTTGSTSTETQTAAEKLKMQNDSIGAAKKVAVFAKQKAAKPKKVDKRPLSQRIAFNLNTSFWVNTSSTFFEFSPVVSYRFPKIYSIGAGPAYIYNRDRIARTNLSGWGGKVFGRAQFLRWIYGYTEYQGINNEFYPKLNFSNSTSEKSKHYVDSWFLSLGTNIRITKRHGISFQALYNVLYNRKDSPYMSAWTYRIGFGF